jgi:predicted ATPase
MIERLYIHNYGCLENFELITKQMPTALLYGNNGSGKSTVRRALTILQSLGRGINRVGKLVGPEDFARGRSDVPIRIEIDAVISERSYNAMPDFGDIQQVEIGPEIKSMNVSFQRDRASMRIPFKGLSDGEKCFLLGAVVLAASKVYGPLFCFWDEPDNFLSISEVGRFVMELRSAFSQGGQLIATSHNPEAVLRFSDENTLIMYRNSHFEPTLVKRLDELAIPGDLVSALIRGDVAP